LRRNLAVRMENSPLPWFGVMAFVVGLLPLDLLVFNRRAHEVMLGLRAMYFALASLMRLFHYLAMAGRLSWF
jgi:uncharacterized membrane protein